MVVTSGMVGHTHETSSISSLEQKPVQATKKKRLSSLFTRDHSPSHGTGQAKPTIQFFVSNKQKDMKKAVLTIRDVTQSFAVYPERPELINQSSLLKIEGSLGDEEVAAGMRNREGWLLVIPEPEGHRSPAVEMRKFLIGEFEQVTRM